MNLPWLLALLALTIVGALIASRIDDLAVQSQVRGALRRAFGSRAGRIRVRSRAGRVTLYGVDRAGFDAERAMDTAFCVNGVSSVHDAPSQPPPRRIDLPR